jgi:hypothetical protein
LLPGIGSGGLVVAALNAASAAARGSFGRRGLSALIFLFLLDQFIASLRAKRSNLRNGRIRK